MVEAAESMNFLRVFTPVIFILGSVLAGLLVDRLFLAWLQRIVSRTNWRTDDVIIHVLRSMIVLWFLLFGIYMATLDAPVGSRYAPLVRFGVVLVFVVSATLALVRLGTDLVRTYDSDEDERSTALSIIVNVIRIVAFGLALTIILQMFGVPVTPALAALGVGGLALSLALQDTLNNLISGIVIILSRQIRPGNYIRLSSGEEGYVTDINWRNTKIRALANNMIIIPNAVLTSKILTNYYEPVRELAVLFDVGVGYECDLEHVEEVTIDVGREVMREVTGGVPGFDPFIRFNAFQEFRINFTVILRSKEFVDQYLIKHEFVKRLHKRYRQEGIEIAFPVRNVYFGDGNGHRVAPAFEHEDRQHAR